MVDLTRFSGYRMAAEIKDQQEGMYRWANLRNEIAQYLPLMELFDYNFYRDDFTKSLPPLDVLLSKVQTGELFFAFTQPGVFIGLAAITDIEYGRNATIEALANPRTSSFLVGKAMGELLTYAFNPLPKGGLGLIKLKAKVVRSNNHVHRLLSKLGFRAVGVLAFEALHNGNPEDIILYEKLNPLFFPQERQVIHGRESTERANLHSNSVRQPGQRDICSDAENSIGAAGGGAGEQHNGASSELAEPEPVQRKQPGRTRRTVQSAAHEPNAKLVQPKRNSANGRSRSVKRSR